VILYVMLFQKYPFGFDGARRDGGVSPAVVYRRVRLGWPEGLEEGLGGQQAAAATAPTPLSAELAELLGGMLTADPALRWDVARIRASRWLMAAPPYRPIHTGVGGSGGLGGGAGGGAAPATKPAIRLPPRAVDAGSSGSSSSGLGGGMMIAMGSYGSYGSLSGLGYLGGGGSFPSFSGGNDGLLSRALQRGGDGGEDDGEDEQGLSLPLLIGGGGGGGSPGGGRRTGGGCAVRCVLFGGRFG
jgi:hypothetical protein